MTVTYEVGRSRTAVVDFDDWVAARGPALLRLAYVLTGNATDAEDVVQDALSRALPRWPRISRLEDPDAYVRRMVVNAHVSGWRKFRRREVPVEAVRDRTAPSGTSSEERDRMWRACRALPPDQRTAVVLRFYEDLDYAEIADLTGVREGSVRSRVSRGSRPCDTSWETTVTDTETDFEARLRDALGDRAAAAPDAAGLAHGARSRLRRRRTTWAVVATAVVAAAIPVGLTLGSGSGGDGTPTPDDAPLATQPVDPVAAGFRAETWHDLTFEVPESWRPGGPSGWCADGGTLDDPGPGVARPDTLSFTIGCTPVQGYGVTIGSATAYDAANPSGSVWQYDAAEASQPIYPNGAWIGSWYDERDVVVVVTEEESLTRHVVDSVRRFEGPDPHGCPPTLGDAEAMTSSRHPLTLCRYDEADLLAASGTWTGEAAATRWAMLEAAPIASVDPSCNAGATSRTVILDEDGYRGSAVIEGCRNGIGIYFAGATREVTGEVLQVLTSIG